MNSDRFLVFLKVESSNFLAKMLEVKFYAALNPVIHDLGDFGVFASSMVN